MNKLREKLLDDTLPEVKIQSARMRPVIVDLFMVMLMNAVISRCCSKSSASFQRGLIVAQVDLQYYLDIVTDSLHMYGRVYWIWQ